MKGWLLTFDLRHEAVLALDATRQDGWWHAPGEREAATVCWLAGFGSQAHRRFQLQPGSVNCTCLIRQPIENRTPDNQSEAKLKCPTGMGACV